METARQADLIALLARIDQALAESEAIANDPDLEMHDLFKLVEARDGLRIARRRVEALLNRGAVSELSRMVGPYPFHSVFCVRRDDVDAGVS
jgi:hypothetical protein